MKDWGDMKGEFGEDGFSYEPLTPVAFLERSASVYADQIAVIDGEMRISYREFYDRSARLAALLRSSGIEDGDRVAVLAPNNHVLLESHYGVPLAGAVIVALNTRLSAGELGYIMEHAQCKALLCDPRLLDKARKVLDIILRDVPLIIADEGYESALRDGPQLRASSRDERSMIALNYTSGTTGSPKGVMYHHRGAYLQALAMAHQFELRSRSAFLWTLPMFHCNGWCFTWAVTAAGGVHVCMPEFNADSAWKLIREERVTHFCGAPTVLSMITASDNSGLNESQFVRVAIGGSPPSSSLIERCEKLGLSVTHLYGLTETFGPAAICDWKASWDSLSASEKFRTRARQGVGNVISQNLRVVDSKDCDVIPDGLTVGEIIVRGNNVMLGYYLDEEATRRATRNGWFHTGDLAVMHPDSYIEIRDRMKDVIVSGGENISSIEVESAIISHSSVLEVAVVAVDDEHWGERPIAFVTLRENEVLDEDAVRTHVRQLLAGFKVPDHVVFDELPKTGTGKIMKYRLREAAKSMFGSQHG
jgi:fatty-acyl-CoA synthase